jgi:hypothetical protein
MAELNIELFKKIRDRIAEIPESYDQSAWIQSSDAAPCGTAACLAGEAIICAAPSVKVGIRRLKDADDYDRVPERAAKLLGLPQPNSSNSNESGRLFQCGGSLDGDQWYDTVDWPEPFRTRFNKSKTNRGRANAAVAYLDWIIKNKRLE